MPSFFSRLSGSPLDNNKAVDLFSSLGIQLPSSGLEDGTPLARDVYCCMCRNLIYFVEIKVCELRLLLPTTARDDAANRGGGLAEPCWQRVGCSLGVSVQSNLNWNPDRTIVFVQSQQTYACRFR